ncbi:MAG: sulfur carrier protein ThiS [Thermoguttaceae bacterium]
MKIRINDEERDMPVGTTVFQLLEQIGLAGQFVAVERNKKIVPHQTFRHTLVEQDDVFEVVSLVGGG